AGSIIADKERGLYRKIVSMPVKPWKEITGRILAILTISIIGTLLFFFFFSFLGAEFTFNTGTIIAAAFFLILIFISSTGIGLFITTITKSESAATHLGIGFALLSFFLGGMAIPYAELPVVLQVFARIHPVTSSTACIEFLLEGVEFSGYNPFEITQILMTLVITVVFFSSGFFLHTRKFWELNNCSEK
ncbi:MAG: ABC transporter permease, partial [Candidatus Hodarchaeales archaeon]